MAPLVEPAQRPRTVKPVPPGHAPAAPGAGGLCRQGAPHHQHATPGGLLCHHAPGNRDRHPGAGDARGCGAPGQGVHPLLQQPAGGDGSHFHLERGGPPQRGQQQVGGGARGAQFHRKLSPGRPRPWRSARTGEASPSSTSTGCKQAAPRGRDGRRSGPTYKCMPRHAALVGDTPWSSRVTPTSTWMPPPTEPRSTSARAGRPAVSGGPRQAARRT